LKQLPEASADAFAHELNDMTEQELQKELDQNEKALQDSLKKPGRLEVLSELPPNAPDAHAGLVERKEYEEPEAELPQNVPLNDSEEQEKPEEDVVQEKKTSGSGLIYFRSSPPPSEKK
jgi:hypothetical protein